MSRALLAGIMIITGLHAFDELVLVIAMPTISSDLNSGELYGFSIASYLLAAIVGLTWAGKKTDESGPFPVLLLGICCFAIGIALALVAWDGWSFIAARILQGIGGGIGWTLTFAIINLVCSEKQRASAIMAMDLAWILPSVLAPSIGGLLVDYFHWRWIFAIQLVPLALAAALVLPNIIHLKKHNAPINNLNLLVDALRIAFGVGLFLYILSTPFSLWWLFALPCLAIALKPFNRTMPSGWWNGRSPLALSILIALISFIGFYGLEIYQPLYLIDHLRYSTVTAGFLVTSASVSWTLGSYYSAHLQKHLSPYRPMFAGSLCLLLGIVLLAITSLIPTPIGWIYASWAVAGFGMGMSFNATRTLAMNNTPANQEGFVATAITLAAQMGIGLSSGLGGVIKNMVERNGGDLHLFLLLFSVFSVVACVYGCVVLGVRVRRLGW